MRVIHSTIIYSGKVFSVQVDKVADDSGRECVREVVSHHGGAVVVPFITSEDILLVQQYRHPFKQTIYELPAGKLESSEDPMNCARRELEEETGYTAKHFHKLGSIYTTPGFCSEELHLYLASDLEKLDRGQRLDEGEHGLTLHRCRLDKAINSITAGEIKDGKTICGLFLAKQYLKHQKNFHS